MSILKPNGQENPTKTPSDVGANQANTVTTQSKNTPSTSTTQSTRPIGRPTDYKPEYCEQLVQHMKSGLSFPSFAGSVGVCQETIYEWSRVHPEFLESKRRGLEACRYTWEKIGFAGVTGKLDGFNATTYIFTMKNRFPQEWRDRHEIDHSGQIEVKDQSSELKERLMALLAEKVALQAQELLIESKPSGSIPTAGLLAPSGTDELQPEYAPGRIPPESVFNSQEAFGISGDDSKNSSSNSEGSRS